MLIFLSATVHEEEEAEEKIKGQGSESHPLRCCSFASDMRAFPFLVPALAARSSKRERAEERRPPADKSGEADCSGSSGKVKR